MSDESTTLLTFPCDFTIKVFGKANTDLEAQVLEIVQPHLKESSAIDIKIKPSENGNYIALNVTIPVDSKQQLDNIYQQLSKSPLVLMAL